MPGSFKVLTSPRTIAAALLVLVLAVAFAAHALPDRHPIGESHTAQPLAAFADDGDDDLDGIPATDDPVRCSYEQRDVRPRAGRPVVGSGSPSSIHIEVTDSACGEARRDSCEWQVAVGPHAHSSLDQTPHPRGPPAGV